MSITVEQLDQEIVGLKGQQQQVQNQFHQIAGAIALLEQLHKQLTTSEVEVKDKAMPVEKPQSKKKAA